MHKLMVSYIDVLSATLCVYPLNAQINKQVSIDKHHKQVSSPSARFRILNLNHHKSFAHEKSEHLPIMEMNWLVYRYLLFMVTFWLL